MSGVIVASRVTAVVTAKERENVSCKKEILTHVKKVTLMRLKNAAGPLVQVNHLVNTLYSRRVAGMSRRKIQSLSP